MCEEDKPTRSPCSLSRRLRSCSDHKVSSSLERLKVAMRHFRAAVVTDFLQVSCSSGQSDSFSVITSTSCHLREKSTFSEYLVTLIM